MHRFRCYDNISRNAKCQRGFVLALCLVHIVDMVMWRLVIFCCGRMVFYFYYCRFYWLHFRAFVCMRITGDPYAVNLHTLIDSCCVMRWATCWHLYVLNCFWHVFPTEFQPTQLYRYSPHLQHLWSCFIILFSHMAQLIKSSVSQTAPVWTAHSASSLGIGYLFSMIHNELRFYVPLDTK